MNKDENLNKLIDKRVKTFLGYGEPSSKIWFIGMEEGGLPMDKNGNLWRNRENIGDAFEYYHSLFEKNRGKTFENIENSDWKKAWGNRSFILLYKLLLYLEGKENAFEKFDENFRKEFLKNFGKIDRLNKDLSNCFLEFNPIPFREDNPKYFFWNYIQDGKFKSEITNRKEFLNYIGGKRLRLLKEQLELHRPEKVIFYSKSKEYGRFFSSLADDREICERMIKKGGFTGNGKKRNKVSILFFRYGITKIFVIPHTNARGMSLELLKKVGDRILE